MVLQRQHRSNFVRLLHPPPGLLLQTVRKFRYIPNLEGNTANCINEATVSGLSGPIRSNPRRNGGVAAPHSDVGPLS
jgi:hypothetical protein